MALNDRSIWLDGELVPFETVQVHLLSQSLQRGTLVFDVMTSHTVDGVERVFGLTPHVRRFMNSMSSMGMECTYDMATLISACAATSSANPGSNMIKISAYFDEQGLGLLPKSLIPRIAIAAVSVEEFGLQFGSSKPAHLITATRPKMPNTVLPVSTKVAASYTHGALETILAIQNGGDAVLFFDDQQMVAEGTNQSFFSVVDGEIYTSAIGTVLEGVTRAAVIEIASELGIRVHEQARTRAQVLEAEEAFMTATSVQVMAIERLDDDFFAQAPGPVTRALGDGLQSLLDGTFAGLSDRWLEYLR